jgi:hypothetical protein
MAWKWDAGGVPRAFFGKGSRESELFVFLKGKKRPPSGTTKTPVGFLSKPEEKLP